MFDRIGSKIKGLASIITVLGIIASVIISIPLFSLTDKTNNGVWLLLGLVIMIGGSLLSWVGSLCLYGFGELIERTCIIEERLSLHPQMKPNPHKASMKLDQSKQTEKRMIINASREDLNELFLQGLITNEEYEEAIKHVKED